MSGLNIEHTSEIKPILSQMVDQLSEVLNDELELFNLSFESDLSVFSCMFKTANVKKGVNSINHTGKLYASRASNEYYIICNVFIFVSEQRVILSNSRGEYLKFEYDFENNNEWKFVGWQIDEYAEYENIEHFDDLNVI